MSLRVLMTADTAGGVWIYAVTLCAGLVSSGVRVRLVALGSPSPPQREAVVRLPGVELLVRPVRLEWMSEPWRDLDRLALELPELAEAGGVDLVHLNHLVHGHLDWGRPVLCAVHSCVPSWFESVRGHPAPAEWNGYRERVRRSLQAADGVVAPSRWMLESARRLYGPFRRADAIANGSSAPIGDVDAPRQGVLAAGRVWDDAKNLSPLQALAPTLPTPLEIAGARQAPGGPEAVPETGETPQAALWSSMRRAAVFAAPALYEPFGLSVLEAARSGCALVLGDIPSLRETWNGAATFVDPVRPASWPAAIGALLERPALRRRHALAAQARAARYTVERMTAAHLSLYRRLMQDAAVEA